MKIAIIQFSPVLNDLNATIARLDKMLDKASEADLVVLPELANSGYNFVDREEAVANAEVVDESQFVEFLRLKSIKHDFNVVTGFCEREGELLYNSAVIIDETGVIGKYRKVHLFLKEKDIFEPGDLGFPVFEVNDVRIGILICFDWSFPEAWRILGLKGADLVCHPCNLVLPGLAQKAVPSHGICNRYFVILANRTGTEGGLTFTGNSLISGPRGTEYIQGSPQHEEVLMCELDPKESRDKIFTPRNKFPDDRRVDVYRAEGLMD